MTSPLPKPQFWQCPRLDTDPNHEPEIHKLPQNHDRVEGPAIELPSMAEMSCHESRPLSINRLLNIEKPSYLLSLPLELRMKILTHSYPSRNVGVAGTMYKLLVNSPPPINILLVCRQIRDEAMGEFYRSRTFATLVGRRPFLFAGRGAFSRKHIPHVQRLELHYHIPRDLISNPYTQGYDESPGNHPVSAPDFGALNHRELEYVLTVLENFALSLSELTITWCNTSMNFEAHWCHSFVKVLVPQRRQGYRLHISKDPYHKFTGVDFTKYPRFQAFHKRDSKFMLRIQKTDFPRTMSEKDQQDSLERLILWSEFEGCPSDVGEVRQISAERDQDGQFVV